MRREGERPGGRRALLAAALLLGATACATGRPLADRDGRPFGEREEPLATTVRVEVTNQRFEEVTVYVQNDAGFRRRLGTVESNRSRAFDLSTDIVGQGGRTYTFTADPVGARGAVRSTPVSAGPGETAVWIIEPLRAVSPAHLRG